MRNDTIMNGKLERT